MHDTVVKLRKRIRDEEAVPDSGQMASSRFQEGGLSRAISEPLSTQMEFLYLEAHRWQRLVRRLVDGDAEARVELYHSCRHIQVVLDQLIPFLERAEDSLSEREEITHRESSFEREVDPFSRLESTREFRELLSGTAGAEAATSGAQAEADLLKVVYAVHRLQDQSPKPTDLYAMVSELLLDCRRHLRPAFADGSPFMKAIRAA